MKTEQLVTLHDMKKGLAESAYFGITPVEYRQVGEGSVHKSARKEQRKLQEALTATFPVTVGENYLYHVKTGMVFPEVVFPTGQSYFIGMRSAGHEAIDKEKPITFIGGMCIGECGMITGLDGNGQIHNLLESDKPDKIEVPIQEVSYQMGLTVYDVDTIKKFTNVTQQLSADSSVFFHLPVPEYVLYALQYYQSGIFSPTQTEVFCAAIKDHGAMLQKMLAKRLPTGSIGSPLSFLLHMQTAECMSLELDAVLQRLSGEDDVWDAVIKSTQPKSWTELSDSSYAYMYLKKVSQLQGAMNILGVENPEEMTIFLQAKKIAEEQGMPFHLTCLYPHSPLFTTVSPHRLFRHPTAGRAELKLAIGQYT